VDVHVRYWYNLPILLISSVWECKLNICLSYYVLFNFLELSCCYKQAWFRHILDYIPVIQDKILHCTRKGSLWSVAVQLQEKYFNSFKFCLLVWIDVYFAPWDGYKVLRSLCLCVCPLAYLKNYTSILHEVFGTCYLWLWLGSQMAVQYVLHFRLCGWRHVSQWGKSECRLGVSLWLFTWHRGQSLLLLIASFMVALCNRETIYIFILWFLSSFFSSPNLSGRTLDVYHTSTHGVALVRI